MKLKKQDLELVRNSELFDPEWYLEQYPDVAILDMDPAEHFLWLGAKLMRNPSLQFYMRDYLEANPDVARSATHPFVHYEKTGRREGRYVGQVPERFGVEPFVMCKREIVRHKKEWNKEAEEKFLQRINIQSPDVSGEAVSIIMPTRNRATCIGAAIESVIKQDHPNWELIIIDDGSTDNTEDIVRSFNDSRIRFFPNLSGTGVSSARNFGMRAAEGKWIFFLDSDNRWRSHFLTVMLRFLQRHGLEAAYAGANLLDDSGQSWAVLFSEFDFETCLAENFVDLNGFAVRRSLVGVGFDETIRRLVDWDFILKIAARTRLLGAPFVGVEYYDGSGNGRISRNEYTDSSDLKALLSDIRGRAKSDILDIERPTDLRQDARIAVVFHVYHKHVVEECLRYIDNIHHPFDLYITTSYDVDDHIILCIKDRFPDAIAIQYANIGSDVGPFMELVSTLCSYDLVCKIHTKRDVHRWKGAWRQYPLHTLLGSKAIVDKIVDCFRDDPDVVASGPAEFYKSGEINSIPSTLRHVKRLANQTGLGSHVEKRWGFFAGTMFWIRPQMLLGMARNICDTPSYSKHVKQDGAPEHGMERLLGICLLENSNAKVALTKINMGRDVEIDVVPAQDGHCMEGVAHSLDRLVGELDAHGTELGKSWLNAVRCHGNRSNSAYKRRSALEKGDCVVTTFIPTYNQEGFIAQAIESALMQNRDFGYEILISDDGSTDGTRDIIARYCADYSDIVRSIGDGVNRGISGNFRRGFESARGKYVAILEGDDHWIDPDKVKKQKLFLDNHENHSMVFSKILVHDIQRNVKSTLERQENITGDTLTGFDFLSDPNMNLIANFSCCMFRTELMRNAPELIYENRINEIGIAFYFEKIGPIGFIDEVMSVYLQHANGVWTGSDRKRQLESGLRTRQISRIMADARYRDGIDTVIEEKFLRPLSRPS